MLWIVLLLVVPLVTALSTWLIKHQRRAEMFHLLGAIVLFISGVALLIHVVYKGQLLLLNDYIFVDSLSGFLIFILVIVVLIASIYSIGYLRFEVRQETMTVKNVHQFYLWFHIFIFTMITVMVLNNIALVWVAIEFTTLVSALLIAFYRKAESLEAAWKYLIIGSLGIAFALFGILFLYAAGLDILDDTHAVLNWTVLHDIAVSLDPTWVTIAFVFILVGYGTKAGLAPLHFWLPDAHSEAPSPVSALLSGVLLNTALYGVLRVYLVANITLDSVINSWLIGFGLLSIGLMVPFIIVQEDVKRMLAYSSVEHIGIITFGIGIGGPLGIYGAILHMLNHSLVKSLLFMSAGNINQKFQTKDIFRLSGVVRAMPLTGIVFIVGVLAIAGAPPFNIFISEFTIMLAGFKQGFLWLTAFYIEFILIIFAGMAYYMSHMAFGKPEVKLSTVKLSNWSKYSLVIPLVFVLLLGVYVPEFIEQALQNIVNLFEGVNGK